MMNSNEFIPVVSGLLLGAMLGGFRSRISVRLVFVLAGLLGFLATWASGELRLSWGYVPADISLVGASVLIAFTVSHWLRQPA